MTSEARLYQLALSVKFLVENSNDGSMVECGVWRGGSMMCVALVLLRLGDTSRDLYLFDTFEGMTQPETSDVRYDGIPASEILALSLKSTEDVHWAYASLDTVRQNLASTGYPEGKIHFIVGKVEETIPAKAPAEIALLRLDTDWYSSTMHELVHLYPRLTTNGVLIIDDFGYWEGSRKAVEEYFHSTKPKPLFHQVDEQAIACVKPWSGVPPRSACMPSETRSR
jgi:O-methyltransferase